MRETVRGDLRRLRARRTSARCVEAGEPPRELWDALAEKGYLGVNLPERYGGGGLGMSALQAVGEEISAAGCSLLLIVVSPAIVGSILVPPRHRGLSASAGCPGSPPARRGSRSRSPSPTPAPTRTTSRPRRGARTAATSCAGPSTTSPGSRTPHAILVVARKREADGTPRPAAAAARRRRLARARAPARSRSRCAAPDKQWQLYFDDVEVPAERLIGESETVGLKAAFDGLNPERIMGAALSNGAGSPGARARRRLRARAPVVWSQPIGAHQGISHPLAQAKIELELARLMTQKAAALYDAGAPAGEAANMAKYAAAEAGDPLRRPGDPDPRRQRLRARVRAHRPLLGRPPRSAPPRSRAR